MILLILLVCLLTQDAFCVAVTKNSSNRYSIGLFYENGLEGKNTVYYDNSEIEIESIYVNSNNAFECLNSVCSVILRHPTVGIIGPTSKVNVDTVQSFCSVRKIPHILIDYVGPLKGKTQISFHPNMELLAGAYIDILNTLNWKQFTFISTSENHATWGKFIEKAENAEFIFDVDFISPHNSTQARNVVDKLKEADGKYFVIDCLKDDVMTILYLLQDYGMITKGYSYFFTGLNAYNKNISTFKSSGVEITTVQLFSSNTHKNSLFKSHNFSYLSSAAETLTFDAVQMFANSLRHLKPIRNVSVNCENHIAWEDGERLLTNVLRSSYNGLTGEIRFGPDRYRNTFELYIDILKRDGMTEILTWNTLDGVKYTESSTDEESTVDDWRKKPLAVITALREPYTRLKMSAYPLQGNDRYEGFAIDLIDAISKIAKFEYTIQIRGDGLTGSYDSVQNKYTGMIGDVQMKRADLAISDITITTDRMNTVDFTHPIIHTGISILFQKPLFMPPNFFYFARPFSREFWTAIAVAFIVVTISMCVVGRLCKNEWQKISPMSKYNINQLTFINSVWFVAGSLFRQSTRLKIRSVPGRIIAASWWLFCFIVIAMYIAALVSYKEVNEKSILFSDVQTLVENAEKRDIKYGAKMHGATMDFFMRANTPLYHRIGQYMADHLEDMPPTIYEGVRKVENERYAFFTDEVMIDYITQRHCQLAKYGGLLNHNAFGIAVRPNSSYLSTLNSAILELSSTGTLEELKRKWWESQGICDVAADTEDISFIYDVSDISGLIWITLLGVTLAVIIGLMEFFFYVSKISKQLKIGFYSTFKQEIKRCFKGNRKTVIGSNLIARSIPENDESATSRAIELM